MNELPKRFPEYSIMYRTLKKQIKELETQKKDDEKELDETKLKIQKYNQELEKIRKMFPENYFEE